MVRVPQYTVMQRSGKGKEEQTQQEEGCDSSGKRRQKKVPPRYFYPLCLLMYVPVGHPAH